MSITFHVIVFALLMLNQCSFNYEPSEYVELSFGVSGEEGSSGAEGNMIDKIEEISEKTEKSTTESKNKEVKEVELPVAENTAEDNTIMPAADDKEIAKETQEESTEEVTSQVSSTGRGNESKGEGSFGYDIDWGGKGTRKIYSFILPSYPEGVRKEVNIKLQFTILPDGTVGTIIPKTKADTRLENAAINSLRQWRFEALGPNQKQVEQTAIIVFPYRLQ
jgi:protein TonB